jgi:hypothetical protein
MSSFNHQVFRAAVKIDEKLLNKVKADDAKAGGITTPLQLSAECFFVSKEALEQHVRIVTSAGELSFEAMRLMSVYVTVAANRICSKTQTF